MAGIAPIIPGRTRGQSDAAGSSPLDIFAESGDSPVSAKCLTWAIRGFVGLGILLRVVRYLMNYPLWHDEAFVAANFLKRGYLDLMRPLDYYQVSPLFFLWIELTTVKLLGFSEWSLRLFPTLCSVGSVILFRRVAGRVLGGVPLLLAVAIFAVAFYPIRHGAEVKPYASDLLAALVLLAAAVEYWRSPGRARWLWALAAVVPPALGLSNPAVFVAGGISLALAGTVWKAGRRDVRVAFLAYNVVTVAAFLAFYTVCTGAQSAEVRLDYRHRYWAGSFPPMGQPWALVRWLVRMHTGNMFAYPIGGERGASAGTFACVATAAAALWRRGRRAVLALCLAPFGLAFLAAVLGRYPYGGEARLMQFVAPATCLLAGLGAAAWLARLGRPHARRGVRLGLLALAALGLGLLGRDLVRPYRTVADVRSRAFARWFWDEEARDAELACIKTDLGIEFEPWSWRLGLSAVYLCNQRIYSPRHRAGLPPRLHAVSPTRPLRCVLYSVPCYGLPGDHPGYGAWLSSMSMRYDLRRRETYPVNEGASLESWQVDRYVVHEFVPKARRENSGRGENSVSGEFGGNSVSLHVSAQGGNERTPSGP